MRNFLCLCKIQLLSLINFNKVASKSKKAVRTAIFVAMAVGFVVLLTAVFIAYGFVLGQYQVALGKPKTVNAIMIAFAGIISFAFGFYAVGNLLFRAKDYELLASMPIKRVAIIASKLIIVYLLGLVLTLCSVIAGFILLILLDSASVLTFSVILNTLLMAIISPCFSLLLSVVIGTIINLIASSFKRKNLIEIILMLAVICLTFALSFISEEGGAFSGAISKIYFIFPIVESGVDNILFALLFVAICVASLSVSVLGCSLLYTFISTKLRHEKTSSNYKIKDDYKKAGQLKAVYKKEMKRIFSVTTLVFGLAMLLVVAIVLPILLGKEFALLPWQDMVLLTEELAKYIPAFLTFTIMLTPTTNCSISLEGSSVWLIKSLPIDFKKYFMAKLLVYETFALPIAVISTLVVGIVFKASIWLCLLLVLIGVLISLCASRIGLLANLFLPKYNFSSPAEPVKRGGATLITMMVAFVFTILFGVGAYFLNISVYLLLIIESAILLATLIATHIYLIKKGEKLFFTKG